MPQPAKVLFHRRSESNQPLGTAEIGNHLSREPRFEFDGLARQHSLCPDENLPGRTFLLSNQEQLHPATRRFATVNASRDDTCLIKDQEVRRPQVLAEIAEDPVLDLPIASAQYEQARRITRFSRFLRDQVLRQGIVEVGRGHT